MMIYLSKLGGVSPVENVDAFEGIEVNFEGLNGNGTAELDSSGTPLSDLELEYELDE